MEETLKKTSKQKYITAHGRRKEATARIKLFEGPGEIVVNDKPLPDHLRSPVSISKIQSVFAITKSQNLYNASIKVTGSGKSSQVDAIVLGLARALSLANKDFRPILKKAGFLTRDPRVKERRKFGLAQKARKGKQSPKR